MIKVPVAGMAGLLAASAVCAGVIFPAFSASPKPVISEAASAARMRMAQTLLRQAILVSGEDVAGLCGHGRQVSPGWECAQGPRSPAGSAARRMGMMACISCSMMARRSCCIAQPIRNTSAFPCRI